MQREQPLILKKEKKIWGHEKLHHNYTDKRSEVFPTYVRRIAIQMGYYLPSTGKDAPSNAGLGKNMKQI